MREDKFELSRLVRPNFPVRMGHREQTARKRFTLLREETPENGQIRPSGRMTGMSTLAVVEAILRDAAVPLSVREIVERAGDTLPTKSKTPDTVVARDLSMDLKKKGEASLFIRTSPGRYAMREQVMMQERAAAAAAGENGHAAVMTSPQELVPPAAPHAEGNGSPALAPTPVLGAALSAERAPTRPATQPPVSRTSSEEISA
jgi:hypothetical protein